MVASHADTLCGVIGTSVHKLHESLLELPGLLVFRLLSGLGRQPSRTCKLTALNCTHQASSGFMEFLADELSISPQVPIGLHSIKQ